MPQFILDLYAINDALIPNSLQLNCKFASVTILIAKVNVL